MSGCVFCAIVAGDLPAYEVIRTDAAVVFLDHRPLFPGHCLVVPPAHHETLVDLPADRVEPLFSTVRQVAGVVEKTMSAGGTFVAMNNRISQSVPHLHVHVVPRNRKDGLRGFFWPRYKYDGPEEMQAVRDRIAAGFQGRPA